MNYVSLVPVILLLTACASSVKKYTVIVNDVEGLEQGSQVVCEGLPVGRVVHMELYHDSVAIDIEVSREFDIPKGSVFVVEGNILGTGKLAVEKAANTVILNNSDTVRGFRDRSVFSSLSEDTARQRKVKASVQKIAEGFRELIDASAKDSVRKK